MNNLIDREGLLKMLKFNKNFVYGSGSIEDIEKVMQDVRNAPAVDAAPVVRCGECIHSRPPLFPHPTKLFCTIIEQHRGPDWYCADGEKEEKGCG